MCGTLFKVILCILKVYRIEFEDIKQVADLKREEKGGFNNRIYCSSIAIESDHPVLPYYMSKPGKYPEIIEND